MVVILAFVLQQAVNKVLADHYFLEIRFNRSWLLHLILLVLVLLRVNMNSDNFFSAELLSNFPDLEDIFLVGQNHQAILENKDFVSEEYLVVVGENELACIKIEDFDAQIVARFDLGHYVDLIIE